MAGSDGSLKVRMDQSDISDILSLAKDKKGLSLVARSCSQPSCLRAGFQSSKVECTNSDSVQSMQLCPNEMDRSQTLPETNYVPITRGSRVVLMVNGLGATPAMELMIDHT